jgi:Predicted membrane protein (DUF2254)
MAARERARRRRPPLTPRRGQVPGTASTLLAAIVGAEAALTGFVVTVTTLIVPMVIGNFSPRYMRLWYRDPVLKATLALIAGTLTFAFSLLRRIEPNFVPNTGVTAAGVLVVASLMLFLFFFSRAMSPPSARPRCRTRGHGRACGLRRDGRAHRAFRYRDRDAQTGWRADPDRAGNPGRRDPGDPL